MEMQKMRGFGIKDCLTEASLGWICFGSYNKDREFYTFNDKYVRDFVRKSTKRGKVAALNSHLESNQCEEILNTNKKHFKEMIMKFQILSMNIQNILTPNAMILN